MIMYCILACHEPIQMDNPENNQHFNVLILVGRGGGLRISTLCTIEKMLTIITVNAPLAEVMYD